MTQTVLWPGADARALRPFWRYYGGKWRAAPLYPQPRHGTIVEPFAGSAGYALRYPDLRIVLVEKYAPVAAIWRFLIGASVQDVLSIPCVEHVDELPDDVRDGARFLVQFSLAAAQTRPARQLSTGFRNHVKPSWIRGWNEQQRARVAAQVSRIRHWELVEGDYRDAPAIEATWFVDPPYNNRAGSKYPCGPSSIDYEHLAAWCRARRGQVIVCENDGADWLPFRRFGRFRRQHERAGRIRRGRVDERGSMKAKERRAKIDSLIASGVRALHEDARDREIVRIYRDEGLAAPGIGIVFRLSPSRIWQILNRQGVTRQQRGGVVRALSPRQSRQVKVLRAGGWTVAEIEAHLRIPKSLVQETCRGYPPELRDRARRLYRRVKSTYGVGIELGVSDETVRAWCGDLIASARRAREKQRDRAMVLLRKKTVAQVAATIGCCEQTVRNWKNAENGKRRRRTETDRKYSRKYQASVRSDTRELRREQKRALKERAAREAGVQPDGAAKRLKYERGDR